MLNIEFIGIPRAGKTTVADYLELKIPQLHYYPERHDLVPSELNENAFLYNFWYSKYCIESLNIALGKPGIHLFERGVIDHIIIGKVHYKLGLFTEDQLRDYLNLLDPFISKNDQVFVFLIPFEVSVERAKKLGKDVTKAIPYISALYEEYIKVKNWIPSAIYLPEKGSIEEIKNICENRILNLWTKQSV